jgi:hypothetical protein
VDLNTLVGVFSRKFIVGFFIPMFFGALALAHLVDQRSLPESYRSATSATQTLAVGVFALLFGLLLSGLNYSLLRLLEGYWLVRIRLVGPPTPPHSPPSNLQSGRERALRALSRPRLWAGDRMMNRWRTRRRHLEWLITAMEPSAERTEAARRLYRRFPASEAHLLPTEFGNVIRSFETHPRARYSLDGIAIWPRISAILTENERSDLEDASADVAFWVNSLTVVAVGGIALLLDRAWYGPREILNAVAGEAEVLLATWTLTWFIYRQAVASAVRWGDPVRAAFDVHRLELYDSLGVRRPTDEHQDKVVGDAIGRLVSFGEPLHEDLRPPSAP